MEYINFKENIDENKLKECANKLREGKLGIFPTDTIYGLGTNGYDIAVLDLFKVKEREYSKPISLLVSDIEMIEEFACITELERKIIEKCFPGALTLVVNKRKDREAGIISSNNETIGVRMPDNALTLKLINLVGFPLATTSANISGKSAITCFEELDDTLKNRVSFFIDTGKTKSNIPSTVIKVENGEIKVLREGAISLSEILEKISK